MSNTARPVPNAPRGPAAMRSGPTAATAATGTGGGAGSGGMASPMSGQAQVGPSGTQQGPGAQRYSTQGTARAKPY